ncbi:calcium dependent kinase CDPK7 [Babesia ovis]|uniref:Calcium dependent kinase CDPK7 n=1 Tax=Babesia ovis TaxID=5869 RepID=A0A9W5TEA2_BABOV|nr:calcium dependent kinase CDPK7 [Babesia ovis]
MVIYMFKFRNIEKELLRRFDRSELEILTKLYKELANRAESRGIDKETFLQFFNLPGLWGERLFKYFDKNESGYVDFCEFITGVALCCRGTRSEKINVLFHVFNLHDNGKVEKSELLAMLSNFPVMANHLTKCEQRRRTRPTKYIFRLKEPIPTKESDRSTCSSCNTQVDRDQDGTSDTEMKIKKSARYDTNDWHELTSSMSRFSLRSRLSNYRRYATGETEEGISNIVDGYSVPETPRDVRRSQSDCINNRNTHVFRDSWGECSSREEACSPPDSGDNMDSQCSTPRGNNETTFNGISIPWISELGDEPKDLQLPALTAELKRQKRRVRRRRRGKKQRESRSRAVTPVERDAASTTARGIIQHEKLSPSDDSALDVLVDQILEDCKFSANESLDFDSFKSFINNNPAVLTMFTQYMHEEVWLLYGNAFMVPPQSRSLLQGVNGHCANHDCNGKANGECGNHDCAGMAETQHNLLQTAVLQSNALQERANKMLMNNGKLGNEGDNMASAQLWKYLCEIPRTNRIRRKATWDDIYIDGGADSREGILSTAMSFHKRTLSCPNCKSSFFMCPKCFKDNNSLHLSYNGGVHIACKNCSVQNTTSRFDRCWFCNWSFSEGPPVMLTGQPEKQLYPLKGHLATSSGVKFVGSKYGAMLQDKHGSVIRPADIIAPANTDPNDRHDSATNACCSISAGIIDLGWPQAIGKMAKKTGYMYKRGRRFNKWLKRYYVLIDNILYYYSNHRSVKPKGCIFLEGYHMDPLPVKDASSMFGFSIFHRGYKPTRRNLYLYTNEEREEWVEALSKAMHQQSLMQLYHIREQLGYGKFSVVYRGVHKETGEEYAIKVVDKTQISCQERELLRSEIAILRLLRHQHVIYLKEVSDMHDSLYIVMELVRGGELYDLISQKRCFTEAHTHKIIYQLLQIVAYLHKCGIVHRDIKPENILLTDKSDAATIKLTDFGLSTLCGPNELLTQPCGTLAYVAPEVLTLQGYNQKVDVWSIGVIMYLLLRGKLPFSVKKPISEDIYDHYRVRFDGKHWDSVSTCAKDLIVRMLQPDPNKRITVSEAMDHFWVHNFVAVNHDESVNSCRGERME